MLPVTRWLSIVIKRPLRDDLTPFWGLGGVFLPSRFTITKNNHFYNYVLRHKCYTVFVNTKQSLFRFSAIMLLGLVASLAYDIIFRGSLSKDNGFLIILVGVSVVVALSK